MDRQRSAPRNGGSGQPVARPASLHPGTRRIGGNEYTIHAPIDRYSLVVCSCWLTSMSGRPYGFEIDKAALNIDRGQLHADLITDIQALKALHYFPFNRNVDQPGPGAFIRSARHNGVEAFADARLKQQRRS